MAQGIVERILERASSFDQVLAGLCPLEGIVSSSSYDLYQPLGWDDDQALPARVTPDFPSRARSLLILALAHPAKQPSLDWWHKGNTEGIRRLIQMAAELERRLTDELGIWAEPLPYYPEKGGVFLKEAAALAGLGVIGRGNLFISPQYGTRVRLRALLLDQEVTAPGPPEGFDPCADCPAPCQAACPQGALSEAGYSRERCMVQMDLDREAAGYGRQDQTPGPVKYCRRCEHACLANRK